MECANLGPKFIFYSVVYTNLLAYTITAAAGQTDRTRLQQRCDEVKDGGGEAGEKIGSGLGENEAIRAGLCAPPSCDGGNQNHES